MEIVKPVIRTSQLSALSTQELAGADYEVVDSINFKDIKELKKLREVTVPIIKNTMPDTILKIKPLPR